MIEAAMSALTPSVTSAPTSGTILFSLMCDAVEDTLGDDFAAGGIVILLLQMAEQARLELLNQTELSADFDVLKRASGAMQ